MKTKINNKGFTLVELMIVTAIVGILAAVAIPTYMSFVEKAKLISSVSALQPITMEMEGYASDHGGYPTTIDFTNFTDQNGNFILTATDWAAVNHDIFSWDNYSSTGTNYTITVSAIDSAHTTIYATPLGITH